MRSICERIAADQLRRDSLVEVGLDRARQEEGLAEAGDALVGMDLAARAGWAARRCGWSRAR